jgi:hypothetical protein
MFIASQAILILSYPAHYARILFFQLGGKGMFKPLRVNELLKDLGLVHQAPAHPATHHEHVTETIDVNRVQTTATTKHETHTHAHVTEDIDVHEGTRHTAPHANVKAQVDVATVKMTTTADGEVSTTLSGVHATVAGVAEVEMTPPHPPREDTPLYMKTHHHLVFTLDKPCVICGVRKSTLADPKQNRFKAKDIETHHHPIERCLLDACDPKKVSIIFPQVKDRTSLEAFVDSEDNMMVLCDIHHRHPLFGIHHLIGPDFNVQSYLYAGYQVAAEKENEAAVMAADEKIVKKHLTSQEISHGETVTQTTVTKPNRLIKTGK